jgi:hypothetical protein
MLRVSVTYEIALMCERADSPEKSAMLKGRSLTQQRKERQMVAKWKLRVVFDDKLKFVSIM